MSVATPVGRPIKPPHAQISCVLEAHAFQALGQAADKNDHARFSRPRLVLRAVSRDRFGRGIAITGQGRLQTVTVPGHDFASQLTLTVESQDPAVSYQPMGLISRESGRVHKPSHLLEFPRFDISHGTLTLDLSDPERRDFNFVIVIERSSDGQMGALDVPMVAEPRADQLVPVQPVRVAPLSFHQLVGSLGLSNSSRPRWWSR